MEAYIRQRNHMQTENFKLNLQLHVGHEIRNRYRCKGSTDYQQSSYVFRNSDHAAASNDIPMLKIYEEDYTNPTEDVFERRIAAP